MHYYPQAQCYFFPTHQGIAFDLQDELIDGQNRLAAIVRTGIGVWILVARGVDRLHIEAVDRGLLRSDYDNINMSTEMDVSHIDVAIAKAMYLGLRNRNDSLPEFTGNPLVSFLKLHVEAIEFVSGFNMKGISAPILAMAAKAYYHMDHDDLAHFLQVLRSGVVNSERDQPIIKLRDFSRDTRNTQGGGTVRKILSAKTLACIVAFKEGRQLRYLQEIGKDPFPIEGSIRFAEDPD